MLSKIVFLSGHQQLVLRYLTFKLDGSGHWVQSNRDPKFPVRLLLLLLSIIFILAANIIITTLLLLLILISKKLKNEQLLLSGLSSGRRQSQCLKTALSDQLGNLLQPGRAPLQPLQLTLFSAVVEEKDGVEEGQLQTGELLRRQVVALRG
ncbi:hypothetical protein TYRP_020329 [Tyrophagus putrescentiae]|nr:hypothetical protein TYRP_020329 [Tyrophagus putrescentiae]